MWINSNYWKWTYDKDTKVNWDKCWFINQDPIQIEIKDINLKDHGKLSFIDLAGSERTVDIIDANKQTKFGGEEINLFLLNIENMNKSVR